MKKIISLFKRDYDGTGLVYDEVVPGAEWVTRGEGVATEKFDGTCCMVRDGVLYKRYDRKLKSRSALRKYRDKTPTGPVPVELFKVPPEDWEACSVAPDENTGHWPGWVPVNNTAPADRWHREGGLHLAVSCPDADDGTYELVGPKVQCNLYRLLSHELWAHGNTVFGDAPTRYADLVDWLTNMHMEGIVWHHPDGRMVKIKRRDFGLEWP